MQWSRLDGVSSRLAAQSITVGCAELNRAHKGLVLNTNFYSQCKLIRGFSVAYIIEKSIFIVPHHAIAE